MVPSVYTLTGQNREKLTFEICSFLHGIDTKKMFGHALQNLERVLQYGTATIL